MDKSHHSTYAGHMPQLPKPVFLNRDTPPKLLTLVMVAGLAAATMNIYLPSLPNMTIHFQTEYRLMQLSVSFYLLFSAVLQLIIGPLSDRYGRRPVLLVSIFLFMISTIGTLVAPTAEIFLLFRLGQATVVSGMVLSRAIVRDMVPAAQAASMMAFLTMGMSIVPMAGPAIGGFIDQVFGWKGNFAFLLLLGFIVFWLVWADLGETSVRSEGGFRGQIKEAPELFTSPRFWGYTFCLMLSSGAFFAYLGGAPFVGSDVFNLSSSALGLVLGSPALGYLVGNAISGVYSTRIGINNMVLLGTIITAIGMSTSLSLFVTGHGSVLIFFGFMTTVGLGNGMVLPNATAGMLSVRPSLAGTASGLGGAMMIGGGAGLSALAGALLKPGSGATPLLWVMWITSMLAIGAIVLVIMRENHLAKTSEPPETL